MAEYREANRALVTLAQRDLRDFWSALNLAGDPARIRNAVLEFFPELLTQYGDVAALLGADWYDMLRDAPPSAASFRAALARPADAEQAVSTARWALGPLFQPTPDTESALSALMGATQRLVLQPGRDTVWDSAATDSFRVGVARVPSGVTTCKFCVMLASRGAVYRSEISAEIVVGRGSTRTGYDREGKRLRGGIGGGIKARGSQDIGKKFHDNCDCVSVVVRSPDDYPDGYNPDSLLELVRSGSGIGRDEPAD